MAVTVPRRQFLQAMGAAAAASTAGTLSNGLSTSAQAQADRPTEPASAGRGPADLVLKNGKVITVNAPLHYRPGDRHCGRPSVAVGSDAAMVAKARAATPVIDLNGRLVIPGTNDGHVYMDGEGLR